MFPRISCVINRKFASVVELLKIGYATKTFTSAVKTTASAPNFKPWHKVLPQEGYECSRRVKILPNAISLVGQLQVRPSKHILDIRNDGVFRLPTNTLVPMVDVVVPENVVDAPPADRTTEKRAARLIVIRRRKMKKHKLRKLRKKMKFEWAKVRLRREVRKEKAFRNELIAQMKQAEAFDPKHYVADKLRRALEVPVTKKVNRVNPEKAKWPNLSPPVH